MLGYTHTPPEQTPPQSRHPPGADTPGADTPLEQTPPEQTPPEQTPQEQPSPRSRHPPEHTSPEHTHPPGADTPRADIPQSRHPPPGATAPPEQTPPESRPPHRRACWEIRSTRGRFASYWNAILFIVAFTLIHKYHNILFIVAKKTRDNTLRFKKYSGIRVLGPAGYRMRISLLGYQCTKLSSPRKDLIAPT